LASPAVSFADEQEFTSASACAAGRPTRQLIRISGNFWTWVYVLS